MNHFCVRFDYSSLTAQRQKLYQSASLDVAQKPPPSVLGIYHNESFG